MTSMQLPTGRHLTHRDITPELEIELARRCQAGDSAAGGVLVAANEPMIYAFVRRYFRKGAPAPDILQAARLGFFKGIMKYNPAEGARLTTYALYWARNEAVAALHGEGSTIRIPRHVHERLHRAARSGEPLDEEAAEAKRLLRTPSIDAPAGDGCLTRGEREPSSVPGPEAILAARGAQERSRELVERALTWLTARQREVIERHLLAEEPEPFEAIGARLGVTKQAAELLQKRAKAKLKLALQRLLAQDDAVLWGGELPSGPVRPRRPPRRTPVEPAPASGVVTPKRRRAKVVAPHGPANDVRPAMERATP